MCITLVSARVTVPVLCVSHVHGKFGSVLCVLSAYVILLHVLALIAHACIIGKGACL